MGWQSEYAKLMVERLKFKDLNVALDAYKDPKILFPNFQKRFALLRDAALAGDPTAKAMYLLLCEDFMKMFIDHYKSSQPTQDLNEDMLATLQQF